MLSQSAADEKNKTQSNDSKDAAGVKPNNRRPRLVKSSSINASVREVHFDAIPSNADESPENGDNVDLTALAKSTSSDSADVNSGVFDSFFAVPSTLFSLPSVMNSGMQTVMTGILGIGESVPLSATANLMSTIPATEDVNLEAWLASEAGRALQNMSNPPHIFKHIRVLFVQLYDSLDNIKINLMRNSVNTFKSRLGEFVTILGAPSGSVLFRLQSTENPQLPPSSTLREIEDALSRAWMYFNRFTKSNALLHLLNGADLPSFMFAYDHALATGCQRLIDDTSKFASVALLWNLSVGATPVYKPHCHLISYFTEPNKNNETNEAPISEEGMKYLRAYHDHILQDTKLLVDAQSYMVISQLRLRDIWVLAACGIAEDGDASPVADKPLAESITFEEFEAAVIKTIDNDGNQVGDRVIFGTPKYFLSRPPVPGVGVEKTKLIASDALFNLKSVLTSGRDGKIYPKHIAMVSKSIPYDENRLSVIFEILQRLGKAQCTRMLPPPKINYDSKNLIWEHDLYRTMYRAFQVPGSINNVYGPRGVGKSTRVLATVHAMAPQVDVVAIDLRDAMTESSMMARVSNQLYFPYSVYGDVYMEGLIKRIKSLKTDKYGNCPIIVFEGIDNMLFKPGVKKKATDTNAEYLQSLKKVLSLFTEFLPTLSIVLVSTHAITQEAIGFTVNPIRITELSTTAARNLAHLIYPAATADLIRAGRCHVGTMVNLADQHSFMAIRSVSKLMAGEKPQVDHKAVSNILSEDTALSLIRDETLCGTILWRGMTPFDEAMGWVLCRKAFQDDMVRWRIAWIGLVEAGWMHYTPDIGYTVSNAAMVMDVDENEKKLISVEAQWDSYILHWAGQCIRIHNNYGLDIPYFIKYKPHFITLFGTFFPNDRYYQNEGSKNTLLYQNKIGLAMLLAGNVSKIAQLALEPQLARELIYNILVQLEDKQSLEYLLAITDLAIEDARSDKPMGFGGQFESLLRQRDGKHGNKHPIAAHAWAVLGYLKLLSKKPEIATECYTKALEIWGDQYRRYKPQELMSTEDIVNGKLQTVVDSYRIDENEWESAKKRKASAAHTVLAGKERNSSSIRELHLVGHMDNKSCCTLM